MENTRVSQAFRRGSWFRLGFWFRLAFKEVKRHGFRWVFLVCDETSNFVDELLCENNMERRWKMQTQFIFEGAWIPMFVLPTSCSTNSFGYMPLPGLSLPTFTFTTLNHTAATLIMALFRPGAWRVISSFTEISLNYSLNTAELHIQWSTYLLLRWGALKQENREAKVGREKNGNWSECEWKRMSSVKVGGESHGMET